MSGPGDRDLTSGDPLRESDEPGARRAPAPEERPADRPLWEEPPSSPLWTPPSADLPARGLVLADWWRRVGAQLIDGAIIAIVAGALFVPLGIGVFDDDPNVAALIAGFLVATLIVTVVALLYAPLMMSRTNGQTLGRMVTGIRVVRADGSSLTLAWAALREVAIKAFLVNILNSVTFGLAGLLDVLWPLWDEENRALHDFVADTRVVRA